MSKFDEKLANYLSEMKGTLKMKSVDEDLLRKVTKGCGPSIYNKDAETVSSTDPEELGRVKKNFLMKKLGLADSPELDAAIADVVKTFGSSNRKKYRPIFYYLLAVKFGKESIYG